MNNAVNVQANALYEHPSFLPLPLISKIKTYCKDNSQYDVNLLSWNYNIVLNSGPIILFRINGELHDEVLSFLKSKIKMPNEPYEVNMTFTLGGRYSYIPWHDDSNHLLTVTVYLSEVWDRNWGGAFVYESGREFKAIYPEFNKAIYFKPPLQHCTIMPTVEAPFRESLQIFMNKQE